MRAAVVQAGSYCFDTPRTLEKLELFAEQAAAECAELAVFPEAFIGGYPKGADFGARVGSRSEEGRDWFRRYHSAAIDLPGPELDRIREIAARLNLSIVAGVIERDRGTLYCTAIFIDREGNYRGKRRKLMPTAMERLIWGFGDGSTLDTHDMGFGRVGAAICWENQMPLLRSFFYAEGVQIWCAPTVDDREQWRRTMSHIANEGRCFVLAPCQYSVRSDYPADYEVSPSNEPDPVLIRGGSAIYSPMGETIAGPLFDREGILVADIDLGDIVRGKFDLDVAGHYARPDVFELRVKRKAGPAGA